MDQNFDDAETYRALLEQMDPEALMRLGVIPEEQQALAQKQKLTDALRGTAMPEGRMVGRTYVAASPFQTAANVAQRILGGVQSKGIEQQQQALLADKVRGRMEMVDALRGSKKRQAQSAPATPLMQQGGYSPTPFALGDYSLPTDDQQIA